MADQYSDRPPFRCRSLVLRANGGAVADLGIAILRCGDVDHRPVPLACRLPSRGAVAAVGVGGRSAKEVRLRSTRTRRPEDTIQNAAIVNARHARGFVWQHRLDYAPFEVNWIVSVLLEPESDPALRRNLLSSNAFSDEFNGRLAAALMTASPRSTETSGNILRNLAACREVIYHHEACSSTLASQRPEAARFLDA